MPSQLNADNRETIKRLLALPDDIRGYGHVKEATMAHFQSNWAELLSALKMGRFRDSDDVKSAA